MGAKSKLTVPERRKTVLSLILTVEPAAVPARGKQWTITVKLLTRAHKGGFQSRARYTGGLIGIE
jgi:hypothetical protein